ncbi:Protein still life, isoforms C/SIF type 2 [Orchesella cincta]|uniref:Protein still life, isoforms C/SIF type 2 n=1 Tax=Orchesella cincta TaxID=48709 RepID=A0A1D2NN19_ORCCI|nr:Protein still life, isoforms C/SIF type 2 [Orchesella cincta]
MSRISDDERMSLTTAVSDDEPGDGANSPKGSRKPAASFNCTGAVRKAGYVHALCFYCFVENGRPPFSHLLLPRNIVMRCDDNNGDAI